MNPPTKYSLAQRTGQPCLSQGLAFASWLAFTRNDKANRTTISLSRLMLTVLGGLAEFERELIRTRTGEGRARAVARGQRMGRPPKLTPHQRREAIRRREKGETLAEIGRSYNVSGATISRLRP